MMQTYMPSVDHTDVSANHNQQQQQQHTKSETGSSSIEQLSDFNAELAQLTDQNAASSMLGFHSMPIDDRASAGKERARSRSNSPCPRSHPFERAASPGMRRRALSSSGGERSQSPGFRRRVKSASGGVDYSKKQHIEQQQQHHQHQQHQQHQADATQRMSNSSIASSSAAQIKIYDNAEEQLTALFGVLENGEPKSHVPLRCRILPPSFWNPSARAKPGELHASSASQQNLGAQGIAELTKLFSNPLADNMNSDDFLLQTPMRGRTSSASGRLSNDGSGNGVASSINLPDILVSPPNKSKKQAKTKGRKTSVKRNSSKESLSSGVKGEGMDILSDLPTDGLEIFGDLGESIDVELSMLGLDISDTANATIFDSLGLHTLV